MRGGAGGERELEADERAEGAIATAPTGSSARASSFVTTATISTPVIGYAALSSRIAGLHGWRAELERRPMSWKRGAERIAVGIDSLQREIEKLQRLRDEQFGGDGQRTGQKNSELDGDVGCLFHHERWIWQIKA